MANRPITINVIAAAGNAQGRPGTFLGPPPHVKYDVGDVVTINTVPPNSPFKIVFAGLSPFPVNEINETSSVADRTIEAPGSYHYQVSITVNGTMYRITGCPEMEI